MNEKLQYATMLEIPVNTANVTFKPKKFRRVFKKKIKNPDAVKEELLLKVNSTTAPETVSDTQTELSETAVAEMPAENIELAEIPAEEPVVEYESASVHKKAKKPLFKFTAVTAEIVAVFALLAVIFLTNAFYQDSAINVFMRKVFSPTATQTVHEKTYDEFAPVINFNGDMAVENGVITCSGSGSVYAPADGTVSSVEREEDGTYTVNIAHSAVFSSTLSGLSYAYLGAGDKVYGNIPVGYVTDGGFTACFNSENALITDYTLKDNAVLWAV
ncbi:MAG: hypothetical protein IJQ23_02725 [Clostridia bacterium]|nr:hypothetical protein [Clostridia bacterium]